MKENWKIFVVNHTPEDTTVFLRGNERILADEIFGLDSNKFQ